MLISLPPKAAQIEYKIFVQLCRENGMGPVLEKFARETDKLRL
jgi:hypothetical protein